MCLTKVDWKKKTLHKRRPKKTVIRWKVMRIPPQPYMKWVETIFTEKSFEFGKWFKAKQYKNTPMKCGEIRGKYISGFHVYPSYAFAMKKCRSMGSNSTTVIPVECSGLLAKGRNLEVGAWSYHDVEVYQWIKPIDPRDKSLNMKVKNAMEE